MKPSFRILLMLLLLVACAVALPRCNRRLKVEASPDLTLYEGLGAAAAEEIQRWAPGGNWLVVAVDPGLLPRYGTLVRSFKEKARGETAWHFLSDEQSVGFQGDGLGGRALREILAKQPGVGAVVLLGGGLNPDTVTLNPPLPGILAGPMPREKALAALAYGQLKAAIVYRDRSGSTVALKPPFRFDDLFEILHAEAAR